MDVHQILLAHPVYLGFVIILVVATKNELIWIPGTTDDTNVTYIAAILVY